MVVMAACLAAPRAARAQDFFQQSPGPLTSSHESLEGQDNCGKCHTTGKALANSKCLGCHEHEDMRAKIASGRGFHASPKVAGRDCWTCHLEHKGRNHDVMGWAAFGGREKFDHSLTDFPLTGKHQKAACDDCHKRKNDHGIRVYMGDSKVCGSCHKDEQPHKFVRAEMMKCDRCHSDVAWKPAKGRLDFDHNDRAQASFPLEGTHLDVACAKCHPQSEFNLTKDVKQCSACHNNPHQGHLFGAKDCEMCHSPKLGTLAKYSFDHDRKTKFDLDGKHRSTSCYGCHVPKVVKKPARECETCHAKDSRHGDRFKAYGTPPACNVCHPSSEWKPTLFQHNKRTKFLLTGKHAFATCRECHRGSSPSEWERFYADKVGCMGCHKHANVHDKKFGDDECLGCHKAGGILDAPGDQISRYHGPSSRFPLRYAHAKVGCTVCHAGNQWKGVSVECGAKCHEDSLHRGSLGAKCIRCHTGGIWQATKFDHDQDSDYELIGGHTKVKCEQCHPERAYKPTPNSCGDARCHLDEDAHRGKLGNACERCHRETGANIFDHNKQSTFKLENAHLNVACKTCHPSITFKPRPQDCFGCHPEPAVHKGQFGTTCGGCHDTVAWDRNKPVHDVGNFSLAGAHDRIDCRRCHKDSRPLAGTGNLCITCHREDDIHSNGLGPRCGECHSQWSFAPARFDHTTVGCDLQGQHRILPCLDCHKGGNYGGLTTQCYGCHWDDAKGKPSHVDGKYFYCGTCHNINVWLPAQTGNSQIGTSSVCR